MPKLDATEKATAKIIKKSLTSATWWQHVQPEIRDRLDFVIDNLLTLGILFRDAFVNSFKYTHASRLLKGTAIRSDKPGALFGRSMSEECYRSGMQCTQSILDLSDWTKPNDADVQACMYICQYVDGLEQLGFFGTVTGTTNIETIMDEFKKSREK